MSVPLIAAVRIAERAGFVVEAIKDGVYSLADRGQGNGTDCEPDPQVIAAARTVRKTIKERWPTIQVTGEIVDEWVNLYLQEGT